MKVLIFTDSRGEHKPSFDKKLIFPEKLRDDLIKDGHLCVLMLCPYKWTTTMDFIYSVESKIIDIESYDIVILYTGIVEYSPRPLSNYELAYNSQENQESTLERLTHHVNGRIVNNKKKFMELFVDEQIVKKHYDDMYEIKYNGENTKSIISVDILRYAIIPYLKKFDHKIIYLTCNNIVPNWDGDYILKNPTGRPKNIYEIEKYSQIIANEMTNVIDLAEWSFDEIKKYTVDNMHLTYDGSEWIYKNLKNKLKTLMNKN